MRSAGRWRRRIHIAWLAATFLVANLVSAAFLVSIADRHRVRIDATATGEHRLAPLTLRLLEATSEGGGYELVVAADTTRVDPRAWQALLDVGAELEATGAMDVSPLAASNAQAGLQELAQRLADRDADAIAAQESALRAAIEDVRLAAGVIETRVAAELAAIAAVLEDLGPGTAAAAREYAGRAESAPLLARDLRSAADAAEAALATPLLAGVETPSLDRARAALAPAARTAGGQLALLSGEAAGLASNTDAPEGVRPPAAALERSSEDAGERCAAAAAAIDRLELLDVVRVLRSAGTATVAILVGPGTPVAIDTEQLLPPPGVLRPEAATAPALRRRTESLIGSALLGATDQLGPIVVLTHAESARLLELEGAFGIAAAYLQRRGIEVVEWPVVLEDEPAKLTRLDPAGVRPAVYVVQNTYSGRGASGPLAQTGAQRAAELGRVVDRLIDSGAPVLLSVTPSEIAVSGSQDPTVAGLALFGLVARSEATILATDAASTSIGSPAGFVRTDQLVRAQNGEHAVQGAIAGLATYLPWPIEVERAANPPAGTDATPLLAINEPGGWQETQWTGYRRIGRERRAIVADPPTPDPETEDVEGPWPVAWAASRAMDGGRDARLVVVGSNDWFIDEIVSQGESIDGRQVADFPGNLALLEAGVLWLAHRDEFIARGASVADVATIRDLHGGVATAIRWGLVLGLPLLVLVVGGVWQLRR